MDKQYANSWQIPTSSRQRKACSPSPPWRRALIKGTLVKMLLFAVLTRSIRSQPTAAGSLQQHLLSLQPSSSYSRLKYSARNTRGENMIRRCYQLPWQHGHILIKEGSMSAVSSAAASLWSAVSCGELEAPRQQGLLLPPLQAAGEWSCGCTSTWALREKKPGRLQAWTCFLHSCPACSRLEILP